MPRKSDVFSWSPVWFKNMIAYVLHIQVHAVHSDLSFKPESDPTPCDKKEHWTLFTYILMWPKLVSMPRHTRWRGSGITCSNLWANSRSAEQCIKSKTCVIFLNNIQMRTSASIVPLIIYTNNSQGFNTSTNPQFQAMCHQTLSSWGMGMRLGLSNHVGDTHFLVVVSTHTM